MNDRTKIRDAAIREVKKAINRGGLVRLDTCELCGRNETDRITEAPRWGWKSIIVAHHYLGYSHPLAVWFVCQSCNVILGDRTDLTKDKAREYVGQQREYRKERKRHYRIFFIEKQRAAKWRSVRVAPGQFEEWLIKQGRLDLVTWNNTEI